MTALAVLVDRAARAGHDAYERAAVANGWETQKRSRVGWDDLPPENRETMLDAYGAALAAVLSDPVQVIAALAEQQIAGVGASALGGDDSRQERGDRLASTSAPLGFAGVLALLLEATTECPECPGDGSTWVDQVPCMACGESGRVPLVDSQEVIDAMIRAGVLERREFQPYRTLKPQTIYLPARASRSGRNPE